MTDVFDEKEEVKIYAEMPGVTEAQHIRYHPGIFIVCLQGRVVVQLFDSLGVHGVDLDDGDRLVHEVMDERLRIGTGRFVADHHLSTFEFIPAHYHHAPQFIETLPRVGERKGPYVSAIDRGAIARVACHTDVYRHDQRLFFHCLCPLCP